MNRMSIIAATKEQRERRKRQFAREYRAKLKTSPLSALEGLINIDCLTTADVLEAKRHKPEHVVDRYLQELTGVCDYDPNEE